MTRRFFPRPTFAVVDMAQNTIIKLYDEKNSNVVLVQHKRLFDCNFSAA